MSKIAPIARDAIGMTGAGTLLYGVSLFSYAAALILFGTSLVGIALLWARKG